MKPRAAMPPVQIPRTLPFIAVGLASAGDDQLVKLHRHMQLVRGEPGDRQGDAQPVFGQLVRRCTEGRTSAAALAARSISARVCSKPSRKGLSNTIVRVVIGQSPHQATQPRSLRPNSARGLLGLRKMVWLTPGFNAGIWEARNQKGPATVPRGL